MYISLKMTVKNKLQCFIFESLLLAISVINIIKSYICNNLKLLLRIYHEEACGLIWYNIIFIIMNIHQYYSFLKKKKNRIILFAESTNENDEKSIITKEMKFFLNLCWDETLSCFYLEDIKMIFRNIKNIKLMYFSVKSTCLNIIEIYPIDGKFILKTLTQNNINNDQYITKKGCILFDIISL